MEPSVLPFSDIDEELSSYSTDYDRPSRTTRMNCAIMKLIRMILIRMMILIVIILQPVYSSSIYTTDSDRAFHDNTMPLVVVSGGERKRYPLSVE